MTRRSRGWRPLMVMAAVLIASTAAGFVWFVSEAATRPPRLPHADGIVVLTGGSNRIDAGLRLLASGQAPRLLVSGVTPGTSVASLARLSGLDPAPWANRVSLGHGAISTHGNAEETTAWVARNHIRSLIVVTAFYHMPRALAELRRALPGVALYPAPVLPDALLAGHTPTTLRLLASEYAKWLLFWLGAPRYGPDQRAGAQRP